MTDDCCCGGDCHEHGHGPRKVLTKAEKIQKLTHYKEELKKEIAAVDEALEQLSK